MADSHFLLKREDTVPVVSAEQLDYGMKVTSGPYQVSVDNKSATLKRKAINPHLSLPGVSPPRVAISAPTLTAVFMGYRTASKAAPLHHTSVDLISAEIGMV